MDEAEPSGSALQALLAACPDLRATMQVVDFEPGDVLQLGHAPIEFVHFVQTGLASSVTILSDGAHVNGALIGPGGAVGVGVGMGVERALTSAVCVLPLTAARFPAEAFKSACQINPEAGAVLLRYGLWKAEATMIGAACGAVHSIEQRLSRWVLTFADALDTRDLPISQDLLASFVGAARSSVNPALQQLKKAGAIELGRNQVVVADRGLLRRSACGCYETTAKLGWSAPPAPTAQGSAPRL
jgi:CRP-like cAMP-binding protein